MVVTYEPRPLQYSEAGSDAPDNNILNIRTAYLLSNVKKKFWKKIPTGTTTVYLDNYEQPLVIEHWVSKYGYGHCIRIEVPQGYYFGVSVAPDFEDALGGAAVHDILYECCTLLAKYWDTSEKFVRKFGDYVFKAVLKYDDFALEWTFYIAVSLFGTFFHSFFGEDATGYCTSGIFTAKCVSFCKKQLRRISGIKCLIGIALLLGLYGCSTINVNLTVHPSVLEDGTNVVYTASRDIGNTGTNSVDKSSMRTYGTINVTVVQKINKNIEPDTALDIPAF